MPDEGNDILPSNEVRRSAEHLTVRLYFSYQHAIEYSARCYPFDGPKEMRLHARFDLGYPNGVHKESRHEEHFIRDNGAWVNRGEIPNRGSELFFERGYGPETEEYRAFEALSKRAFELDAYRKKEQNHNKKRHGRR